MSGKEWEAADELDAIRLGSAQEERQMAKNWMNTAAQYSRNSDYWENKYRAATKYLIWPWKIRLFFLDKIALIFSNK